VSAKALMVALQSQRLKESIAGTASRRYGAGPLQAASWVVSKQIIQLKFNFDFAQGTLFPNLMKVTLSLGNRDKSGAKLPLFFLEDFEMCF